MRRSRIAAKVRGDNPRLQTILAYDAKVDRPVTACFDMDGIVQCPRCKTPVHAGYTPLERKVFVALDGTRIHQCDGQRPTIVMAHSDTKEART